MKGSDFSHFKHTASYNQLVDLTSVQLEILCIQILTYTKTTEQAYSERYVHKDNVHKTTSNNFNQINAYFTRIYNQHTLFHLFKNGMMTYINLQLMLREYVYQVSFHLFRN